MLDRAERQLEEARAERPEQLRIAGRQEAVLALATAVVLEALARERLRHLARRLVRREDQRDVAAECPLEDRAQERVVRAAEDHGVAAGLLERRRVLADGRHDLVAEGVA